MDIRELVLMARERRASDIHISVSHNPIFRIDGTLTETDFALTREEKYRLILSMLNEEQRYASDCGEDLVVCYETGGGLRHRVNVFHQQRALAAAIRIINDKTPTFEGLGLPDALRKLADEPHGLVLVTGPSGSGKSTTLAAIVDHINQVRACHIITIEDPVEYIHTPKKALIHQRDVAIDVGSYARGLRSAMHEDPDVILVGELCDYEAASAAVIAAESGHLVLSALHTSGAAMAIDHIISFFPPHNQQQMRTRLASALKGVVTQTLAPKAQGEGRVAAFEVMLG